MTYSFFIFFFSSRRRHTRCGRDWSSDVCSSDLHSPSQDWRGLWAELKSIFEFWIGHGVTIFRVDNPHTKAFAFWEWCIGERSEERRVGKECRYRWSPDA